MKRKAISILLIVFLTALLIMPRSAGAETIKGQTVIFTILNNDLLDLNYYTMPYIYNGVVYVPYTDFTSNFGISYIYNTNDNILILSTLTDTLFFEISNKTAYNKNNEQLDFRAITYNGQIYLPAQSTSNYFGLLFKYNSEKSVIRIKDMNNYYSDRVVIAGFASDMEKALEEYREAALKEEPDEKKLTPFELYFAFEGIDDNTNSTIDHLIEKKRNTAFFLSKEDIENNKDTVRRMYVEGFTIGLCSTGELPQSPKELADYYDECNELLLSIIHAGTRLIMIPGGGGQEMFTAEYAESIRKAGYRYWDVTLWPDENGTRAEKFEKLQERSYDIRNNAVYLAEGDEESLKLLDQYIDFCISGGCIVKDINEFTSPINLRADKW